MQNFLKKYARFAFLLLFILLSSFLASRLLSLYQNTLYSNGRWIVSKTRLKKAVVGAYGFLIARNTLAGQHLDLSKWYGFQEVIYKDALDISEITFDLLLDKNSYAIFIFNKNQEGFSGIRISTNSLFKNLYFISKDSGEFTDRRELNIANVRENSWQRCRIIFGKNNFTLFVNKALVGNFKAALLPQQFFGFRGGRNKVLIDNVVVRLKNSGQITTESFDKKDTKLFFFCLIIAVAVSMFIGLAFRITRKDALRSVIGRLIVFNILAATGLLLLLAFDCFYLSSRYPVRGNKIKVTTPEGLKNAAAAYWEKTSKEFVLSTIKAKYGAGPGKDNYRILFLGSSQAWGAGASEESETFISRIERKLAGLNGGNVKYECINAGISGLGLKDTVVCYLTELLTLGQKIVILFPSSEYDSKEFSNLDKLIKFNNSHGIKTIFLLGAISIEDDPVPLSADAREFLRKNDIRIMDLNEPLKKDYDRGLLWWDTIHLTNFGQELLAGYIYEILCKEIGITH